MNEPVNNLDTLERMLSICEGMAEAIGRLELRIEALERDKEQD